VGLLKDWNYVEQAVRIPALAELIREALIRALFVRDDRVLPASIIGDLNRLPPVTVKVKEDGEVRKLIRVLNGEESTVSAVSSSTSRPTPASSSRRTDIGPSRRSALSGSASTTMPSPRVTSCRSSRRSPSISPSVTRSMGTLPSAPSAADSRRM